MVIALLNTLIVESESQFQAQNVLESQRARTIFSLLDFEMATIGTEGIHSPLRDVEAYSASESDERDFDFDSSIINTSRVFERARQGNAERQETSTQGQVTEIPKHVHVATAIASFEAGPEEADELSFSRFEAMEVSDMVGS